jgi:hypothetical protein
LSPDAYDPDSESAEVAAVEGSGFSSKKNKKPKNKKRSLYSVGNWHASMVTMRH